MVETNTATRSIEQALNAIRTTKDDAELSVLFAMVIELYADAQKQCVTQAEKHGEDTAMVAACYWDVNKTRDKVVEGFMGIIRELQHDLGMEN